MTLNNQESHVSHSSTESIEQRTGIRGFLDRKVGKATVAVAGLLIAGGAALGVSKANERGPEITPPVATAEANPVATPETQAPVAEVLPTVESLELDASLLSDPNALIEAFVDKAGTEWINAGATPENAQAALDSPDVHDFSVELASKYDALYVEALVAEGWQSNPAIVMWIDNIKSIHQVTLELYFKTSFPKIMPDDKIPYERVDIVTSVDSFATEDDGSLLIRTTEHAEDNEKSNRVGEELSNGTKVDEVSVKPTRMFDNIDGKVKLSNMILG